MHTTTDSSAGKCVTYACWVNLHWIDALALSLIYSLLYFHPVIKEKILQLQEMKSAGQISELLPLLGRGRPTCPGFQKYSFWFKKINPGLINKGVMYGQI